MKEYVVPLCLWRLKVSLMRASLPFFSATASTPFTIAPRIIIF